MSYLARTVISAWLLMIAGISAIAAPSEWATDREADAIVSEIQAFFKGAEIRATGAPGNAVAEEKVAKLFANSGMQNGEITFRSASFIPGKATLTVKGLPPIEMLAMHPTLMRPGNFPSRDFETDLVYIPHQADTNILVSAKGRELNGTVGVREMQAGSSISLMSFGMKGFLYIEPPSDANYASKQRALITGSDVAVPQYFIRRADGVKLIGLLKSHSRLTGRIQSTPSRWENRMLRDLWAFVPGSGPDLKKDVVLIVSPLDSNCAVPGLAVGAQHAANLHLMLKMFEEFKNDPPARSTLFAAANAHSMCFQGERLLSWNLLAPTRELEEVRDTLAKDMSYQQLIVKNYKVLKLDGKHIEEDNDYIVKLRKLTDSSLGRHVIIKNEIVDLAKRDVNRLKGDKLDVTRSDLPEEEKETKIAVIEESLRKYIDVLMLFNKVGHKTSLIELHERQPDAVEILRLYVKEIIARNQRWSELNARDLEISSGNTRIRDVLQGGKVSFVISLQLTWQSDKVGFAISADGWGDDTNWQAPFGRNAVAVARQMPEVRSGRKRDPMIDTMTRAGGLPEGVHVRPAAGLAVFSSADAMPAFALLNAYASEGYVFATTDTFNNLNAKNVACMMNYVPAYVRALLNDRNTTKPSVLLSFKKRNSLRDPIWSVQIKTFRFDKFAASVLPNLPVPRTMLSLYTAAPNVGYGVLNTYIALTDDRAATVFYGIPVDASMTPMSTSAFRYDDDFVNVELTIDAGDAHEKSTSNIKETTSAKIALFPCKEIPIYQRFDPSKVSTANIAVTSYHVLDGRTDSSPRRYGMSGAIPLMTKKTILNAAGPAAIYIDENERVKILTKNKRVVLNSSEEEPEGIGYASLEELGPDFFAAAARDMSYLNHYRIGRLRGVSDELAQDFMRIGDEALARMDEAKKNKDYISYVKNQYLALGAQHKAYDQATSIANDMLKAVVFYMALMLPFCFFLQKLIFKFVKIETQMAVFALMFVATFIVFRMIHPAFKIAKMPEAMFIAFVMGALGAFVIRVLQSRFDGEMQLLFQTYSGMDTSSVTYSTAGQQAMLIGVNNMKRRRVRTALTTATIVLVTFTMLSFSSISKKMSPTIISKERAAPYTGIMYHWPGQLMDPNTSAVVQNMFLGESEITARSWRMSLRKRELSGQTVIRPVLVSCSASEKVAQIDAVLSLQQNDNGFLAEIPLITGRYFSGSYAREVIVPTGIADILGITPANMAETKITLLGHSFDVVGILDDDKFRAIKDINDKLLVPIQIEKLATDQLEALTAGVEEEEEGEAGVTYVDMAALLIMPANGLSQVQDGSLVGGVFSISIKFPDNEPIWPHAEKLLTATRAKFYISSLVPFRIGGEKGREVAPGVYYVGSGYRTSIGGLSVLIIPLLIASTIILNTMLGSVYERKAEIAIYNAVGLNPTHIGMFFLAEAFVYSVIGSVGGYLIGQILSIILTSTQLVSGINLNFSSLSVVYVILFTISVVLLSTIYPARVATKEAIPSGKRKWSMPDHKDGVMNVFFPFIYQERLLPGIMNYLEEYFARYTEASIGDLIARPEGKSSGKDDKGRSTYDLVYDIALAPYDLGVTQMVTFRASYDERVRAHKVLLEIKRVSGQDSNWISTNRPFLEKMRQHMLHWRNLDKAQHAMFVEQGKRSFDVSA